MVEYIVDKNGCWVWQGRLGPRGYGSIRIGKNSFSAHRIFYEKKLGKIPDGLVIDHLCRNKKCVNPDHLEPVTPKENTLRGRGPTAINAAKTQCAGGHPYAGNNFTIRRGRRYCDICQRRLAREYKAKIAALTKQAKP